MRPAPWISRSSPTVSVFACYLTDSCSRCLSLGAVTSRAAAQSQADAGSKARKQLQDLLARKAEVITKLQVLQQELEMAQNLNPEGE
jgi:hypothetical protein